MPPKLETIFSFDSAQSVSVDEGGGAVAVTIASASTDYTLSTAGAATALLTAIGSALTANGSLAGTYTCTLSATTGKVTISATGIGGAGNFSIAWTSTTIRNVLGFTGTISGASSYTSTEHAEYLWLPGVGRAAPMAPDAYQGRPVVDVVTTLSPDGHVTVIEGDTRYDDTLDFRFVRGNKTWTPLETTTNESFQTFWAATVTQGLAIRYYPDATSTSNTVDYVAMPRPEYPLQVAVEGWVGSATDPTNASAALHHIAFPVVKRVT